MSDFPSKTVLLLHTLPDGSGHFDWLLETSQTSLLLTFRVQYRLPQLGVDSELLALHLPDHRRIYLDFEGPLSENRGTVRQVARGHAQLARKPATLRVEVAWTGNSRPQLWLGQHLGDPKADLWRFVSLPLAP